MSEPAASSVAASPAGAPSSFVLPRSTALEIHRVLSAPIEGVSSNDTSYSPPNSPRPFTRQLDVLLPSPAHLTAANVHAVQADLRRQIAEIQERIAALAQQLDQETDEGRMGRVQVAIGALLSQLSLIREKARESEMVVREITRDIRSLDTAKRNIVSSMTALKRLQMLVNGTDQLDRMTQAKRYKDAAQALQAVKALQIFFKDFLAVERVAAVWKHISDLQAQLRTSVMEEYEQVFMHDATNRPIRSSPLPDAALVVDALGQDARISLLDWYCALQLREYRRIFRATDEAGQLDNVARRFAWFRRVLRSHDEEHAPAFVAAWQAGRCLVAKFTEITRDDIKSVLVREQGKVQVAVLLEALNATLEFEAALGKKYGTTFAEVASTTSSGQPPAPVTPSLTNSPPSLLLSSVFQPYLTVFVEAQDKTLAEMLSAYRRQGTSLPRASSDEAAASNEVNAQHHHHTVLPSSTELFYFYRQALEQCARLSNREPFRDLCNVYKKWLRIYADEVLRHGLARSEPTTRRSVDARPSVPDVQRWCLLLNTADYCAATAAQLEDKLREKIAEDFVQGVSLQQERDMFLALMSACVTSLTREQELALEPSLTQMLRPATPWNQLETVSPRSPYVVEMASALEQVAVVVRQDVDNKRYIRSWCDKVVALVLARLTHNLVKLKPVPRRAAEQLLADLAEIKTSLLELPRYSSDEADSSAAASYVRYVNKSASRLEMALRAILLPDAPPEAMASAYVELVNDRSFSNFQKVLELKGVRPLEQNAIMDAFLQHASTRDDLLDSSALDALDTDPSAASHLAASQYPAPLTFSFAADGAPGPGSGAGSGFSTPPAAGRQGSIVSGLGGISISPWAPNLGLGTPDGMRSPSGYAAQGQGQGQGYGQGMQGQGEGAGMGAGRALSDLKKFGSLFGAALGRREEGRR